MWCIPPKASAEFVSCLEDVPEVYHRPHDPRRPAACMDETLKPLIGEVREPLPPSPGRVGRYDSVYVRNGAASAFLAFEPLAGCREVKVTETRKRGDWAHFIRGLVDGRYKGAEKVVLVMDRLNTHATASLYEAFPPAEAQRIARRLEVHHTPKHGSWPNMAEIGPSALSRDLPERVGDRAAMARHVGAWKGRRDQAGVKADWQFTTADARTRSRKLYPTIDA
jgi:hypothetical protein